MIKNFFDKLISKIKTDVFFLVFFACLIAILTAIFFKFVVKLTPCPLCIWQSLIYFGILLTSLTGLLFKRIRKILFYAIFILMILELSVSIYHIGVEHYIFSETQLCIASQVSCADVQFKFMNLSLTEWNFIYVSFLIYYFISRGKKDGLFAWRS